MKGVIGYLKCQTITHKELQDFRKRIRLGANKQYTPVSSGLESIEDKMKLSMEVFIDFTESCWYFQG